MEQAWSWIAAFGRFWYHFIIGDDWTMAAAVAIGLVLTAVLNAGMSIELFHEFDVTPAPTPWLEIGDDRLYRFRPGAPPFPLTYSLRARRPQP